MPSHPVRLFAGLSVVVILVAIVAWAGGTTEQQALAGGAAERFDNNSEFLAQTTAGPTNEMVSDSQQPASHHDHTPTTTTAELTSTIMGTTPATPTSSPTAAPPAETSTTIVGTAIVAGEVSLTNPVVTAGASLVFDSAKDATLHVRGNMTVLGSLMMHPNPDVTHRIVFEDRGELLVTESGVLDIQGTRRVGWNRTGTDPTWRASDELIVAPIAPGDWQYHPFTLGSAVPTFQGYAAEVANLTRNVVIDGPSRVMLHGLDGHAPQVIKYATIANAGVRDQLGMYALHFHLNGDATRGSIVEGVVVRDSRFRAFVPHGSNGITFRDTLAVNVVANGYWWDLNQASNPPDPINESHDIVYERAGVIGLTTSSPPDGNQSRQAGFNLGDGSGNVVRDSFVAGLGSGPDHSGFQWPAHSIWTAQNLVSHNNRGNGFFVWERGEAPHIITGIDSYLNGGAGIGQGNYRNSYHWIGARLVANGEGLHLYAMSMPPPDPRQTFECVTITDSPVGVVVDFSPAARDGDSTLFTHLVMQRVGEEFNVTEDALAAGQTLELRVDLVDYQTSC
ncbi:MAG: hypothetical protein WED83_01495 [Acidimicrobiia bacterium]